MCPSDSTDTLGGFVVACILILLVTWTQFRPWKDKTGDLADSITKTTIVFAGLAFLFDMAMLWAVWAERPQGSVDYMAFQLMFYATQLAFIPSAVDVAMTTNTQLILLLGASAKIAGLVFVFDGMSSVKWIGLLSALYACLFEAGWWAFRVYPKGSYGLIGRCFPKGPAHSKNNMPANINDQSWG